MKIGARRIGHFDRTMSTRAPERVSLVRRGRAVGVAGVMNPRPAAITAEVHA